MENHSGAVTFDKETDEYLIREVAVGAVVGPFDTNPLATSLVLSPINSIPKRGSSARRFVSDLSAPKGFSVNDGIDLELYYGTPGKVVFPTVDQFVGMIRSKGTGALLYKRDLSRAYRQFFLDPGDICYQGFRWRERVYIDCALVMGCRSAAMMCQRSTTAVTQFLSSEGVSVCAYLDDFAGCSSPTRATADFDLLGRVLLELGLVESPHKAHKPSTKMEFLGILFDTCSMTLEVTPSRLLEIRELLLVWKKKTSGTKKEIQSLVGKLQFVTKCVPAGRLFVARILDLLRGLKQAGHRRRVSSEFRKDLDWWLYFLSRFAGVSLMLDQEWLTPDTVISTDACLVGGGGWIDGEFFSVVFPKSVIGPTWHINALELLVLLIALKLWAPNFNGRKLLFYCDNEATVAVVNSGRCKDAVMLRLLREVVFVCSINNCQVRTVHLAGVENRLADSLSRRSMLSSVDSASLTERLEGWICREVVPSMFSCRNNW